MSMEHISETYAIRALLRHYWKKGINAVESVRQICAVEGPNAVGIEMAHNWFTLFESGHTTLEEPNKMIWLPSENWDEVFKFMSFKDLHQHIQMTCQRFWALSEPILNRLCPRVAKPIKICWESEENLRRIEFGIEIDPNTADHLEFETLEELRNGNLLKWEWDALPSDIPPPNIIGFQRIIIQGQLDRELLSLVQKFSTRISECQMDFNDLANLIGALASQRISLDDFFASFSKCGNMILYRQIPVEFLACPYVLRCPNIEIHWLDFEPESVLNWLKTSSGFATKSLTVYGYYCDASTAEPVNLLLATLISEYRGMQEPIIPSLPEFVVDLCDFEDLFLAEFEDEHISLVRLSETNWRLAVTRAHNNDQQNSGGDGYEKTQIEIGRFFS